jgi:hypothetical protein
MPLQGSCFVPVAFNVEAVKILGTDLFVTTCSPTANDCYRRNRMTVFNNSMSLLKFR